MCEKILTVSIPSYNVEKYLDKTVHSFMHPDIMGDLEVLIVNDGSKDSTPELGARLEQEFPGVVRLVNKENGGHGSTINTGIREAKGKYFKVVDGDDWVDTDAFAELVKKLKETEADLVLCPYHTVNIDSGEICTKAEAQLEAGRVYSYDQLAGNMEKNHRMHSTTYRTDVLRQMRPIDEHCFYVDMEYVMFPVGMLEKVVYYPFFVYQYRIGNSEQSMSWKNLQKNRAMHQKVIYSLLDFYKKGSFSTVKKEYLRKRIALMCTWQVEIYLSMGKNSSAKQEVRDFMNYVQTTSPEIYAGISGKKERLMKLGNGRFFNLAAGFSKDK